MLSSAVVQRDDVSLCLQLPGATEITIALEGERVLGVRDVRVGNVALRNSTKVWQPVIATPEGIHYQDFRLCSVDEGTDGAVTLVMDIIGRQSRFQETLDEYLNDFIALPSTDALVVDRLTWEFLPSMLELDGRHFAGFAYRYHYTSSEGRNIYRIFDDATWEIGGHVEGNTLLCQGQVNPPVTELRKDEYFSTACNYYGGEMRGVLGKPERVSIQRMPRAGTLQVFDFLAHAQGILFSYFDPVCEIFTLIQKEAGEDMLHVLDELRRPLADAFHSHPKHILFHALPEALPREAVRTLWTRAIDFINGRERQRAGITPSPVLPRIWIPQMSRDIAEYGGDHIHRQDQLDYLAEKLIPAWAEMGVREICLPSLWESDYTVDRLKKKDDTGLHGSLIVSSVCAVRVHEIDPLFGGVAAVARFVQRAHAYGIQVQIWWATHLSRRAPIFAEYPDFMTMARDGLPNGGGYGHDTIITLNLANPDCVDWLYEKLAAFYAETDIDGLFIDSYGNMTFLPVNYADRARRGQQVGYERLHSRLQAVGIKTFTVEGLGPFGVGHFGMNLLPAEIDGVAGQYQAVLDWWLGQEDMVYGLNMGIGQGLWPGKDEQARHFAFRCLAAGGNFGFTQYEDGVEMWSGWLREQRQLHARLAPITGRRTMLPQDRGIHWTLANGTQLLFAFQTFPYPLDQGNTPFEVMPAGEIPARVVDGQLCAEPWCVYQIR